MSNTAATLESLIAPLTEADFRALLRERKLTLLHGAGSARYAHLMSWKTLQGMIERGEHPRGLADFRVAKESVTVPADRWLTKSKTGGAHKVDLEKLEELLSQGFSLIITPIERHAPPLAALCDDIERRLPEQVKIGLIVTLGTDGAFKLHYDPEDLIILQLEGTKRWRIYGPPVSNPVIGMAKPVPPAETKPIFDEVLRPGDFLFVPAGNWHHCQNGPGRSLHLGIFFIPPTGWYAVNTLTSQLLSEELFRTPLSRFESDAKLTALETVLKERAIEKIRRLKLSEFIAGWNRKG
jgi:ribosomal protein L16 Arg81 hydroxylase